MTKIKTNIQAQSLFEVLFAVAIAAIILVGVVSLSTTSIRNTTLSNSNALATKYSQEAVEWLRGERDADFLDFLDHAIDHDSYCLSNLNWDDSGVCSGAEFITDTPFLRSLSFVCYKTDPADSELFVNVACDDVDVNNMEAVVETMWTDAQGEHSIRTVSRFTNWR